VLCAGIFGGVVQDVPLTRKGIRNETKAGWAKYCFLTAYYSVADPDPQYFWKPDPAQSQNLGAVEAQNRATVDACNGGVEAQNGAMEVR
jgi:hypothetical protein